MKLFNYQLEEWSKHGPNYWRIAHDEKGVCKVFIGLCCHDSNAKIVKWRMSCWGGYLMEAGPYQEIENIYYSIYNPTRKVYFVEDIENAKNKIDQFIIRFDNLKAFV